MRIRNEPYGASVRNGHDNGARSMSRCDHYPRWRGGLVIEPNAGGHRLRDNGAMIARVTRCGCAAFLAGLSSAASANCESGSFPLFGCDAAKSRKFIELCAPSPLDAKSGFLRYRFGSLDEAGNERALELEYPAPGTHTLRGSTPRPIRMTACTSSRCASSRVFSATPY